MDSALRSNTRRAGALDAAILLLRIASGVVFLYHGSAVLFGAFGGPGPQKFAAFLHAPSAVGYLVGLAQFCGGLAMLSGFLIRIGAVCLMQSVFSPAARRRSLR